MECPGCGSDLPEDSTYCPACLQSISPAERGSDPDSGPLWDTVVAGVLLVVVVLSAVLLLS